MGQRFVACDREQPFLMRPDVREWLPPRHLAWFVIDAVAEMDLDAFYAAYHVDGRSRPAYDPAMMGALLLYAYARGIRSSRVIERACEEDVAFRVLAAQERPDHATIARFVERHQDAIAGLFGEVLTLCARSGLAKVGVIAVDGTKVNANASRDENLDYEQIAREILEEARAVDAAEDELYGEARGDELPEQLRTGEGRSAGGGGGGGGRGSKGAGGGGGERRRRGRSRAAARSGSRRPSGAWKKSSGPRSAPTPPTSATGLGTCETGAGSAGHRIPTRRPRPPKGESTSVTPIRVS